MPTLPQSSKNLKQCQHCFKSENEVRLKCCQRCKRAHYCSPECQKAEWKKHKPECQTIKQNLEAMKLTTSVTGISHADLEKVSKTWVQLFRPHLSVTVVHALEIQRDPTRIFTHILNLIISPNFTKDNIPKKTSELRTAFRLEEAHVSSVKDTLQDLSAEFKMAVEKMIALSKEVHKQNPKALGYPLVVLHISQSQIVRFIPLGLEDDPAIPWPPWDPEWKRQLSVNMVKGVVG